MIDPELSKLLHVIILGAIAVFFFGTQKVLSAVVSAIEFIFRLTAAISMTVIEVFQESFHMFGL